MTSLILGVVGLPTLGCLGLGSLTGAVLGVVALVRAGRDPQLHGGKGMAVFGVALNAIALLVAPFVIGIVAAIAIPSLLRARVAANEAVAIGDLRSLQSAQQTFAAIGDGRYASLECLVAPEPCLNGYVGPQLLPDSFLIDERSGYRRSFYPDPEWAGGGELNGFAMVAEPIEPDTSGVRAFCTDSTGQVCSTLNGSMPPVVDGLCPATCEPIY